MPVLEHRPPVAELAGDLEVLGGRIQLALLAKDVREAHVQVTGGREHRPGVACPRASARSYSRRASAGRPRASHMPASTIVALSSSAILPAACMLATAPVNVSSAV